MKHKRLSALLAAGMMLTALPAASQNTLLLRPALVANAATSGTCGENVTWTLNNGVLTISGTGDMTDYLLEERPFSGLSFSKAVIKDGVTSIGDYTFMRCFGVKSISIPDSVKRIGIQAFYQCTALSDITIPDSVTEFRFDIFNETPWLEAKQAENPLVIVNGVLVDGRTCTGAVTIPDGVTCIGEYAFYLCKTMTEVQIPSSVTRIVGGAFSGCWELQSVTIPDGVTAVEDGAFTRCYAMTSVQIPNSVTSIGASSFLSCTSLKSVSLPDSVTSIGITAFEDCTALESITIPASVTDIGQSAFANCKKLTIKGYTGSAAETCAKNNDIPFESLGDAPQTGEQSGSCGENVTWALKDGVLTISGTGAMDDYNMYSMPFADLTFTKAVISDGVTSIGEFAFYESEGLTEITIADSVTSIGNSAFSGCSALTEAAIPESVTSIGNSAFSHTPWLDAKKQENPLVVVNDMLIDGKACSGDVVIPDGVTGILGDAFAFNTRMTGLTIPDSVTSIGSSAFYECVNLAEISIPASVERIGSKAFGKTPWLKAQQEKAPLVVVNSILVDGTTCSGEAVLSDGVTRINDDAFSYCSGLTNITIPDSLTSIGAWAFNYCTGLTSITIPAGVTSIGAEAFHECRNLTIRGYAGSAAETYATENKIPFEAIGGETGGQSGQCGENLTWELKDGVLTISGTGNMTNYMVNDMPFSGLRFSKLVITDGVTSIGNNAFASCSVLKEVRIPESVTLIGSEAFGDCTALTEVIIPDSVTEIWTAAFGGCSSLTSVKLPDSLTEISPFIFESCPITEITLPSEALYIGDGAFEDCKLTSISIPSKVTSICAWAFCGCPLTKVTIPANVEEIAHDAFNCAALTDITILNPACKLFDGINTINSSATIHGFAGSTAEEYANKYDCRFEAITSSATVSGDYNGDGDVSVADAVLLARFVAEDTELTNEQIAEILNHDPDINGDGLVTIADLTELLSQLKPDLKPEVIIKETKAPDGFVDDDRFESVGKWYTVESESYDGVPLSGDVYLTVPIPGELDPEDLGGYVFVYYDEKNDEYRYLFPDSCDLTAGTMTIDLPHFSFWGAAKLTKEEQIEAFLNSYSTKLAVERGNGQKAASELEPYVRAKAEAMGLTKQATEDLIQSSLNFLGGRFTGQNKAFIESATKYTTTLTRGFYDNDGEAAMNGLEGAINDALLNSWSELKFSDRLDKVLGSEFAGSTSEKLLSSANGIARMAGYMAGGDKTGALKELGSIMEGIHPAVELGTKAVAFLGAKINEAFTNWKSNQIEELYRIYKNGLNDIWGNEVIPCNRDSFLTYLNCSSGFTLAKGVARFYNLDKVGEICEQFGWEYRTYEELPPRFLKEFQQRAEDGLMKYFELRLQQEKTAEEIKKTERACIETMMASGYGALYSGSYGKFFGEASPEDYNLTARLERLVKVRSFVSQYVDEDKLAETAKVDNSYNYGDILNWWVDFASNNDKPTAIQKFREELQAHGFLKEYTDQKVAGLVYEKTVDDDGQSLPQWTTYCEYKVVYKEKKEKKDAEGNDVIVWEDQTTKKGTYVHPDYRSKVWGLLKSAEISVTANGKISCSNDGIKVEGDFDSITKTGLGTLSIHTKYSYDNNQEDWIRACISEGHIPNPNPDYYVNVTIDLTLDLEIKPNSDEAGVLFVLNGGGTVSFSGEVYDTISGIKRDGLQLFEDETGIITSTKPFSGSYPVTYENVQYLYLLK